MPEGVTDFERIVGDQLSKLQRWEAELRRPETKRTTTWAGVIVSASAGFDAVLGAALEAAAVRNQSKSSEMQSRALNGKTMGASTLGEKVALLPRLRQGAAYSATGGS